MVVRNVGRVVGLSARCMVSTTVFLFSTWPSVDSGTVVFRFIQFRSSLSIGSWSMCWLFLSILMTILLLICIPKRLVSVLDSIMLVLGRVTGWFAGLSRCDRLLFLVSLVRFMWCLVGLRDRCIEIICLGLMCRMLGTRWIVQSVVRGCVLVKISAVLRCLARVKARLTTCLTELKS